MQIQMQEQNKLFKQKVPNFINTTYEIVNDKSLDKQIFWNERGDGFIINNSNQFAAQVLP